MRSIIRRIAGISTATIIASVTLAACGIGGAVIASATPAQQAQSLEAQAQGRDALNFDQAQPIPFFRYSQIRAELIDIEKWQATGATSTSLFFSNDGKLLFTCPSMGAPIASDSQLSNPVQAVWNNSGSSPAGVGTGNMDPTGVYTGPSSGTYVSCVSPTAGAYPVYWEGYVMTVGGPAQFANGQVSLTGQPNSIFGDIKTP